MRGDHIYCLRFGLYTHHGIDVGDGQVVHFSGEPGRDKRAARIQLVDLAEFAQGGEVRVQAYGECDDADQVVARAMSRIGGRGYNLFTNNCEHFARWCKTGVARSAQVRTGGGASAASVVASVGTAGAIGAVSTAGTVAGLSGAGVMSGLAAIGGSAVGGIAALGAAPAVVGSVVLGKTVFKDDPAAPASERDACAAARKATYVGTAAGTAGAVGAVSAMGTVSGLSAAGITSGLSAIGGTVGGGMLAGTALTVAAPIVGAVAVAVGVHRLVKWWKA